MQPGSANPKETTLRSYSIPKPRVGRLQRIGRRRRFSQWRSDARRRREPHPVYRSTVCASDIRLRGRAGVGTRRRKPGRRRARRAPAGRHRRQTCGSRRGGRQPLCPRSAHPVPQLGPGVQRRMGLPRQCPRIHLRRSRPLYHAELDVGLWRVRGAGSRKRRCPRLAPPESAGAGRRAGRTLSNQQPPRRGPIHGLFESCAHGQLQRGAATDARRPRYHQDALLSLQVRLRHQHRPGDHRRPRLLQPVGLE